MVARCRLPFVIVVVALGATLAGGACADDSASAVPERLPEALADGTLPAVPKLALERELGAVDTAGGPLALVAPVTAGATWAQRVELHQTVRHGGPGVPRGESDVDQELTVRYAVDATAARVRARIEQAAVRLKPDLPGVVAQAEEAVRGLAWSYAQDHRGRVTSVAIEPGAPETARPGLDAILAALGQASLELPAEPVAPGAAWSVERELALPLTAGATVPATLTTTATFRGLTTRDGRRLAVIDLDVRQRLRGRLDAEGAPAEVVGAALGRGLVLHDVERGRPAVSEVVLGGRQELLVQVADGPRLLVQEHTLRLVTRETAP